MILPLVSVETANARKGWLTKADVINTLPLEKLKVALGKKR
jgi:hypothetical protein